MLLFLSNETEKKPYNIHKIKYIYDTTEIEKCLKQSDNPEQNKNK